jgi:glycosyltransferase involved in cell wall biosynthesis
VDVKGKTELFARARVMLHLNTISKRLGLVLAEANAAGVPVIAMAGSCREVSNDRETELLVSSLADAVQALDRVDGIACNECRKRAEQRFSIETMVEAYERVYPTIFQLEANRPS